MTAAVDFPPRTAAAVQVQHTMSVGRKKTDKGAPKRRCARAPHPVIVRIRTDMEPNTHHPLAALAPEKRAEQRQCLIAAILARLASGVSSDAPAVDTMEGVASKSPEKIVEAKQ